jgi:type II secretion system protein L
MSTTLLLRLPAHGQDETEWLSVDESGMPLGARQRGPLAAAAAASSGATVVALAPAAQILLASPELPPGGGAKLLRAVPFALEEYLTEDIDQLHFSVGRRDANATTPVAVVSREAMQTWSAMLEAAGIEASAVYADMSLLPRNPSQTVLWLEQDRLAVRRPDALPVMVEISPVSEALAIAGLVPGPGADPAAPRTPESVLLYVTPADCRRSTLRRSRCSCCRTDRCRGWRASSRGATR